MTSLPLAVVLVCNPHSLLHLLHPQLQTDSIAPSRVFRRPDHGIHDKVTQPVICDISTLGPGGDTTSDGEWTAAAVCPEADCAC